MGFLDNIRGRISRTSNVKSSSSKIEPYKALFDRKDTVITYRKGKQVLRDSQVSTGYDILRYLLSSKQWILTNVDDDNDDVYVFINDMLKNMETNLNVVVKQMTMAILWGFNVHELIYDIKDGKLVVTNIIPVHIKTLQNKPFVYDDDGALVGIRQEYKGDDITIPKNKVLLYSFNNPYDEYQGQGLLYDFLPIVEDKENLMNWLMTFAEKNGSPTLYGKTNNPVSRDELLEAFEDVNEGTTGIVLGESDEVGVLETSHRGETFFTTLQYKDNQIFRRMFIGNLLLGDNSQTGTYAQSQTQLDFTSKVYDGILEEIANVIQHQIIQPIVRFNYGESAKAPVISFEKFSRGDMQKLFNIIKPFVDNGIVDSENTAVQESLAMLFKTEAGVEYVNETPTLPFEDFGYKEPVDGAKLTENILGDL